MKAITLWQPWASLCVIPRNDQFTEPHRVEGGSVSCGYCNHTFTFNFMRDVGPHRCDCRRATAARSEARRPFKTIETRSWKAPDSLIGQRIAIHAAVRAPRLDEVEPINDALDGLAFSERVAEWTIDRRDGPGDWTSTNTVSTRLPLGAVVGTAVLDRCVPMVGWDDMVDAPYVRVDSDLLMLRLVDEVAGGNPADVSDQRPFGIFEPGRWAWLLTDIERLDEPIPGEPGDG